MIYLSNFANKAAFSAPNAVSIAAITPRGFKGEVRKDLAPKWSLVKAVHKKEMNYLEFAFEYTRIIYRHDLDQLVAELDNHILLCYCSKDEFCHRLLLGLYLHKEIGVEVEEIGGFGNIINLPIDQVDHPVCFILQNDNQNISFLKKGDDAVGYWQKLKAIGELSVFTDLV